MTVRVEHGDSRDVLKTLADNSVDSCCTDPPYSLVSIQKRFGKPGSAPAQEGRDGLYRRASAGFMGKTWDTGETAFDPEFWREVYRVLKPGAHLVAFSGTRTYHRMVCAIEDAGFEIRDQLGWVYGAGFPKSHNISKKLAGTICDCENRSPQDTESDTVDPMRDVRRSDSSATVAPKEKPICVLQRRVPEQNVRATAEVVCRERQGEDLSREGAQGPRQHGVEGRSDLSEATRELRLSEVCPLPAGTGVDGETGRLRDGASPCDGEVDRARAAPRRVRASRRPQAAEQRAQQSGIMAGQPQSQDGGAWPLCDRCGKPVIPDGLGTALKPAWEPICLARKPLSGTVAETVLEHGTGALNIDGCRVETGGEDRAARYNGRPSGAGGSLVHQGTITEAWSAPEGRWPANVIHDGSEEVLAAFPDAGGQQAPVNGREPSAKTNNVYGAFDGRPATEPRGDSGSAARFFKAAQFSVEDIAWMTEPASYAGACSSLQSEAAVSVLSSAVARSMPGSVLIRQSFQAPSTSVTAPEFGTLCETVIATIQSFAPRCLRGQPPQNTTVNVNRAKGVAALELTGTMTITASHWKSDGSAEPVTFGITLPSAEAGEKDSPSAKRFHYSSKAQSEDRFGSKHPTVKPIDLIAYLCRLVTPPGGTVLDPFAGSGTTGAACMREGFDCILIEREAEYIPDIMARIELASADGRHPSVIKHRNVDPAKARGEDLPMFATPDSLDGAA